MGHSSPGRVAPAPLELGKETRPLSGAIVLTKVWGGGGLRAEKDEDVFRISKEKERERGGGRKYPRVPSNIRKQVMKMESKQLGTISVELETPRYWLPCLHLQQKLATSILLSLTTTPVVRQRLLDGHLSSP